MKGLSIIVPTFFREQMLIDTLSMVLEQMQLRDEVLVIDQTPIHEPETEQVLGEWVQDGRLRWYRKHDPGQVEAMNVGALLAVLRLGDVATVKIGNLTRYGAVTEDGKGEAVQGLVLSLRGADASAIVEAVRARLDELKPSFPPGVNIKVFYDRSDLISSAVGTISKALIEATILVVILLVAFLGNLRAAFVVAVTLPFAALVTFVMMQRFGMTANLMSLGGLAIAIGLIVDAAVVVVENTVERLQHAKPDSRVPKLHDVYRAASEVATPVVAGIVIICLVFLPLLSLTGLEG